MIPCLAVLLCTERKRTAINVISIMEHKDMKQILQLAAAHFTTPTTPSVVVHPFSEKYHLPIKVL